LSSRINIEVKDKSIKKLLTELETGKYYLPTFQRNFVWDEDKIKDLIDSIIKSYPIGTLILWKPSKTSIIDIDPFSIPIYNTGKTEHKEIFYIIDGQQRLTSILLMFNDWKLKRGKKEIIRQPISYNPSNKKFYKSSKRGRDLSMLIKAFAKYESNAINELKNNVPNEQFEEMKNMILKILDDYYIPIYIMETEQENEKIFDDMAQAFIRINKYGTRIGNLELMLSFLAGTISGELKKRIQNLYEEFNEIFLIDLQPVLRFIFSNFDLKQTQISNIKQFKKNIEKIKEFDSNKINEIFVKCKKAFNLTIELIKSKLKIKNADLLPSQITLIPIAKYFYNRNINTLNNLEKEDFDKIINWFILTNFNGYYSSKTNTKLQNDLDIVNNTSFPLEKLLENIQNRKMRIKIKRDDIKRGLNLNMLGAEGKAYLFLLYILLVQNEADDWNGTTLFQSDDLSRHHIFPREYLAENLELDEEVIKDTRINNLANITFIHKNINSEIEDDPPDSYLKNYKDSAKKHFIPIDEKLWTINQYDTFLEFRIREIFNVGKKYFGNLFE